MNWMSLNWVDWVIVAVTVFYVLQGWQDGLAKLLTELASFLGSLWLAAHYHAQTGTFLVDKFGLPSMWTDVVGYAAVWFVGGYVISFLATWVINRLPKKLFDNEINRVLGAILSAVKGLAITAFLLLLVTSLPLQGTVKNDIRASTIGAWLVSFLPPISPQQLLPR